MILRITLKQLRVRYTVLQSRSRKVPPLRSNILAKTSIYKNFLKIEGLCAAVARRRRNFFTLWTFLIEFAIEFMSKTQLKYISETVTGAGLTLRGGPGPPFPSKKWGPRRAGPPFFEPISRGPAGPGAPDPGPPCNTAQVLHILQD